MDGVVEANDFAALDLLLEKVYRNGGHDFREYKRGTVIRRLESRLHATGTKTCLEYMDFLDTHPEEYQKVTDVLTIKVSGFFRSQYAFQQIAKLVLPRMTEYKAELEEPKLTFWSTACARGEEPYSIAMLLAESIGDKLQSFDISIYATDISPLALRAAQAGIYTLKDIEGLPQSLLENYFTSNGDSYEVKDDIKRMVSFFYFDLVSKAPPPFSNIDCILCCNVLIYLQKQLQKRVLGMLYDSLANPGYLVLGEVETPTSNLSEKLECIDAKAKIYKKSRGGE